ncbi:type II toxin-antitoxin system RelE/ParE family toxin [Phyllobacterium sp. CCNWLW109]
MFLFQAGDFTGFKGSLEGFWSISVSGNWRIIFRFNDVELVDYLDYH